MWIELSEFNFLLFLPLVFPIFFRIEDFIMRTFITDDNQLFKTFRYFLSHFFSLIPFFIIKLRTKKKTKKEKNENIMIELKETQSDIFSIYGAQKIEKDEINKLITNIEKKRKIKSYLYLLLLSGIAFFCFFYRYLFEEERFSYSKQSVGIFFEIFDYVILSYFILKQKLFKHSYVSASIIAIILLMLFVITIFYMNGSDILPSFAFHFCLSLCFGSLDVIGKRYMVNYFVSPYLLMIIIGIVDVIILLIIDIFLLILDSDIKGSIYGLKSNINSISMFFILILDLFLQWIWILGIWLTVYYLTPNHFFISEYISEYAYYITNAIDIKEGFYNEVNIIVFSVSFIINFFCCLVFNEVIILNFCGLDYNTKKRILERVDEDNNKNNSGYYINTRETFNKDEEYEQI